MAWAWYSRKVPEGSVWYLQPKRGGQASVDVHTSHTTRANRSHVQARLAIVTAAKQESNTKWSALCVEGTDVKLG